MSTSCSMPSKIISGGQTGADRAGLEAARHLGIATGGFAPRGYRTERGHDASLKGFGLVELPTSDYTSRTRENIRAADVTLLLSVNFDSPGTKMTERMCRGMSRPCLRVDPFDFDADVKIAGFIMRHRPATINVAGNRESVYPGIGNKCIAVLVKALKMVSP